MINFLTGSFLTIRQRLFRMSLLAVLFFALIGVILVLSTANVREKIDRIVEGRLQKVVENSRVSRVFGLVNSRVLVLQKTFYERPEYLEREIVEVRGRLQGMLVNTEDATLRQLLVVFVEQLDQFHDESKRVNFLLLWRSEQDREFVSQIQKIQDYITNKTIDLTLAGTDNSYLNSLILQLSGYRESLLEISNANASEDPRDLLYDHPNTEYPLLGKLRSLSERIKMLTAVDGEVARFSSALERDLETYLFLMQRYPEVLQALGESISSLNSSAELILNKLDRLSAEEEMLALEVRSEIQKTIVSTVSGVILLLLIMALLFWVTHQRIFVAHISAPMDKIKKRLDAFTRGDMQTPMMLERHDEWHEIESGFNRMISSLQDSVEALIDSESRYREIYVNATEGIFKSTLDGRLLEVNPAIVEMLGFTTEDEALESITSLGGQLYEDPQDRKRFLEKLLLGGRVMNFETRVRIKDDELLWISMSGHIVWDEQHDARYIEGMIRDISVEKHAQLVLEKLQAYTQNIIDSMPSMLIGVDGDQRVTLWNRQVEIETGRSSVEVYGLPLTEVFALLRPSSYLSSLEQTLSAREPARLLKVGGDQRAGDGERRFFDLLIYPLETEDSRGAVIHIDDATERVGLEEMMVRSEKMQSVGSLASGLAHEINNPLAVILQNAQVLSRRYSPDLGKNRETAEELGTSIETIIEYHQLRGCDNIVASITSAGNRAAKIVENIQSFSRRDMSSFTPSSLVDLLEKTLQLAASDYDLRHKYAFHKVKIVREFKPLEDIVCEPSQIQQVILALIKNAAQALSQVTEAPQLTLRVFPSGEGHACLQVEDNGAGIETEVAKRIFDPFYTTRDVGVGTGLGLSIAYYIVTQNHNGYLGVSSEPGSGSCFEMLLPFNNASIARALASKSRQQGADKDREG